LHALLLIYQYAAPNLIAGARLGQRRIAENSPNAIVIATHSDEESRVPISQTTRAVLYMLAAIGLISVVDTTSKFYTAELHGVVLVWGYFIGITVFVAGNFALRGQFALLRTKRPALQIARPGVLVLSISCLFVSLAYLPIAEATAIGFTGPLFLTALSVPFLGERVGWHRWLAVIVGLAGVMVMVRPGGSVWHWSAGMALLGAIAFAIFQLITRRLSFNERHQTTLLYTSIGGAAWSSLIVPFFWTPPNPGHWLMFLIIGSMGAAAHFCMIQAFATAQASLLAPFNYSKLIWVTILGYLVFGDFPSADTLIGSAIIAFAGLYVLYRESRQAAAAAENTEKAGP
jgi:drug/metabolite transporter (DMT)-like permease